MKKSLDEEIAKFKRKTCIGNTHYKLVGELSPADLNTLKKQGDAAGVCKALTRLGTQFDTHTNQSSLTLTIMPSMPSSRRSPRRFRRQRRRRSEQTNCLKLPST